LSLFLLLISGSCVVAPLFSEYHGHVVTSHDSLGLPQHRLVTPQQEREAASSLQAVGFLGVVVALCIMLSPLGGFSRLNKRVDITNRDEHQGHDQE
jgi:hypothetical protein